MRQPEHVDADDVLHEGVVGVRVRVRVRVRVSVRVRFRVRVRVRLGRTWSSSCATGRPGYRRTAWC